MPTAVDIVPPQRFDQPPYSTGGSGGEDRLTENVSLNFEKVNVEFTTQNEKGGADKPFKMGWNISENVAA